MTRHANISIFVPHIGCSHRCSFCNQNSITGQTYAPTEKDVYSAVQTAVLSKNFNPNTTEIAFFGGSFTAIPYEYMISLLKAAYSFVKDGTVSGIRLSTRPDAIDYDILSVLKTYGVTAIELGAQSMVPEVLELNKRGHTAEDVIRSSEQIKNFGFSLGLQMMTGLYGSSDSDDYYTADKIISLEPKTVRIYPTVVLKNTMLAKYYTEGKYAVDTLEKSVDKCSKILLMFMNKNINVIRLGLHNINTDDYVAGPWHPSFKDLCDGKIYLDKITSILTEKGRYLLYVNPSAVSSVTGQKRKNIIELENKGFYCTVKPDLSIKKYDVKPVKVVENKCI